MKYLFAYGCLTNQEIMAQRCPRARLAGNGRSALRNYRLVCRLTTDVVPVIGGVVHGVIWSISAQCEKSLDEFEGYPWNYTKEVVTVFHEQQGVMRESQAMVYVMTDKPPLEPPQKAYEHAIAQGYASFRVPTEQLSEAIRVAKAAQLLQMERIRRLEYFYPYDEEQT